MRFPMTRFIDTNVLLYAFSRIAEEAPKAQQAMALLNEPDLALSAQVLQEFYVQATRASSPSQMTHEEALALMATLHEFPIQPITAGIVHAAADSKVRWKISYWDAAIIEAARALGCPIVLSEDLQDGQDFDGVRVRNPFLAGS
jgi:predicted nucleic acid-binding protein